ncbi:MAG: hypothetical protein F6K55_03335 [Moorea sp. SIO4A3]|nr:hypothetical protein [Moorena sp. SIO4A3]
MSEVNDFGGAINAGDIIREGWLNGVTQEIESLKYELSVLNSQLTTAQDTFIPFRLSIIDSSTVAIAGGSIKLRSGDIEVVTTDFFKLTEDGIYYAYIDATGKSVIDLAKPVIGHEIGLVTVEGRKVVKVEQYPLASIEILDFNANAQPWVDDGNAVISSEEKQFTVPEKDKYFVIPFDYLVGDDFKEGGFFEPSFDGRYIFQMQIRITEKDYDPKSEEESPLSGKISIFVTRNELGEIEVGTALFQARSARGDLVLNASNAIPVTLETTDKVDFRVYITEGVNPEIRQQSAVQAWRLP